MGTTSKKVKVIGSVQYINIQTGELEEHIVTSVEERDFNFTKVWMRSFLATLDLIGNAKSKVAYWIIENIDKENQLTYTYRQIADAVGVSKQTVSQTMSVLLDAQFLRRKNIGCYIINPDIVFKGTRSSRLNVLTQFHDSESKPLDPNTQLQNITKAISELSKKAEQLSEQIRINEEMREAEEQTRLAV